MFDDIQLWFAKDSNGNIVTIDKIDKDNKHESYTCPICGSEVIAKTGDIMRWHFAHRDASKCSNEAQVHFWIKNELIKIGDKFRIKLDNDIKEFICKEILIEQQYKTEFGIYNPDITIITEDNETIYFEVANTNKKKIEEYLDKWLELSNIVVEVDKRDLINGNSINEFKAIFFKDKCFNINKDESEYYELIGKVKLSKNKYPIEQVNKLSWLWKDINKFILGEFEISELSDGIQAIENEELRDIVVTILRKNKCKNIINDYVKYNVTKVKNINTNENCDIVINVPNKHYDKIYGKYNLKYSLVGYEESLRCDFIISDINEITNKILLWIKRYKKIIKIDNALKNKYINDELRLSYYGDLDNLNVIFYTKYIWDIKTDDKIENIIKNICNEIDKIDKDKEIENYKFDKLLKKYNNNEENIDSLLKVIKNNKDKNYIESELRYNKTVLNDYINYNINNIEKEFNISLTNTIKIPRTIYDRIFGNYSFIIKNTKFSYPLYDTIDNIRNYFYKKEYLSNLLNLLDVKNKIYLRDNSNEINPLVQVSQPSKYLFTNITNMNDDEIDNVIFHNIDLYDNKKLKENISEKLRRRYHILLGTYIKKNIATYKEKIKININDYSLNIYYDNMYIKNISFTEYLDKKNTIDELKQEIDKKIAQEIEYELLNLTRIKTKSKAIKTYDGISIQYEGEILFKIKPDEYHDKNKIVEKINKLIKSKETNKLKINNFINYIKNNTNDCNLIINNTAKTVKLDYKVEGMLYKDFYKYTIKSIKYCSWKNDREEILKDINESINNYQILRYIKILLNNRYEKVEGGWYFETYSSNEKTYLELRKRYNKYTHDGRGIKFFS
jgi:predicted RNA-binding Zn-ribbon protein involved in translation (DUF1610 family)